MTLQVVGFYPERVNWWGDELTLMVTPQRAVLPFRLVVMSNAARDYAVLSVRIDHIELLNHEAPAVLFIAPSMANFRGPPLYPSGRATLRVRADYTRPRRPWLRGSRAERKRQRARFWRLEAKRAPGLFQAVLLCEDGE